MMPDCGVFPLWRVTGGRSPRSAREVLGLDDDLVEQLTTWGQEADYVVTPDGWEERGHLLYRRLSEALRGRYRVELVDGMGDRPE